MDEVDECSNSFKNSSKKLKKSQKVRILRFLKPKNLESKVRILVFKVFFTCVTNLIQMIFKCELRFVAFVWLNLCLLVVILCPVFVS